MSHFATFRIQGTLIRKFEITNKNEELLGYRVSLQNEYVKFEKKENDFLNEIDDLTPQREVERIKESVKKAAPLTKYSYFALTIWLKGLHFDASKLTEGKDYLFVGKIEVRFNKNNNSFENILIATGATVCRTK